MSHTSGRVISSTRRSGNTFQKNFAPNPAPATQGPHASFSGGVTLAHRMVASQTSLLQPVAADVNSSNGVMSLSPNDDPAPTPAPIAGVDGDISTSPPVVGATGVITTGSGSNMTPLLVAVIVLLVVMRL
jgi:hypothetical protein